VALTVQTQLVVPRKNDAG